MNRLTSWLMAPSRSRVGSAPSWGVVFATGAVGNVLHQCWWGLAVCLALLAVYHVARTLPKVT